MTDKQSIALKINDCLNDCVTESGAFFLNTVEAGRPKSRPISFHMLKDGVNYFGVGAMKEVYRQIQENPYVEICGLMGKGKLFFRYYGKAVFEKGNELSQEALAQPGYPVMSSRQRTRKRYTWKKLPNSKKTSRIRILSCIHGSYRDSSYDIANWKAANH